MRKLFILIILLFSPLLLNSDEKLNKFYEDVNNSYNVYEKYITYSTSNYSLAIVRGECNNKLTYGIYFYSEDSGDYSIKFFNEDTQYGLKTDNRGDTYSVAINRPKGDTIIKVFLGDKEQSLPFSVVLTDFSIEELNNTINGLNQGSNVDKLFKGYTSVGNIYMIICGGVIAVCAIVIIVYYIKKKGMFDKDIRSKDVFNIKEFLEKNIEEEYREEVSVQKIIDLDDNNYNEEKPEEVKSVYDKLKDDNFYSNEASGFPLEDYLKDKGFILDYSLIDDEEKNKIMLELINLKDSHKITNDEYLEEVYKLWKK